MSDKQFTELIRANPYYQTISSILHWEDPITTGAIFGFLNIFFFFLIFGGYSFVTLVSYLLIALIVLSTVIEFFGEHLHRVPNVNHEEIKAFRRDIHFEIPPEAIDSQLELVHYFLDKGLERLHRAFSVTNKVYTLKVAVALFLFSVVSNIFSNTTLVYLALVFAFAFPRTYQEKKTEIDNLASVALQKSREISSQAYEKLPPAVKEAIQE
eukprot:TRINITY_DN15657_c0_g1_i1.p1 TRINITY_DN15657_c0_g1~~TRINITY_DN15657_c0_g1_i1.p1  ORF type:complete len:220 (-),score=27.95 TRINITY_DN15657_c0_g1_i1:48-680(-)